MPIGKPKYIKVTASGKVTEIEPPPKTFKQMIMEPAKKPTIATRAGNFSKAMFRWVAEGFPLETKAEANRRVAICESNACGYFNGSICLHQRCGCYANIKRFIATEHCPIGKW